MPLDVIGAQRTASRWRAGPPTSTELSNGAFIHADAGYGGGDPTLTVTLTKRQMLGILAGHGLEGLQSDGDTAVLGTLLGLLDTVDHSFAMVTP